MATKRTSARTQKQASATEVVGVSLTATQKRHIVGKLNLMSELYTTKAKIAKVNRDLAVAGLVSQDMICW
ncbi:MAG: hypothetical protein KZQ99_21920 [Candidatus Thiodiazotropha sp. (ex Dulcina madagascariensis)]|nr:hypothetical protein [Candidatus Thiodiazotropha sp. (ex Epidulcina cf. delphinae)]MCU7924662.1 hypothetical protein [Candidatus Thiodiazotropha sp. (ex Dulcina madagascariensis)]MCU7929023.1 hypothetical protein [Candidatus Thiodiazotropha sp. (ex Dulcina madagascariensis)]MCU7937479.1 hypothetical protein [Candidatus Thiodiazotropha sp. (ex Dulcina madagascariensis)]